jgi:hypothetical protein
MLINATRKTNYGAAETYSHPNVYMFALDGWGHTRAYDEAQGLLAPSLYQCGRKVTYSREMQSKVALILGTLKKAGAQQAKRGTLGTAQLFRTSCA